MKNEPVVTYNHMEEDNSTNENLQSIDSGERNHHTISLYMILIADVILIGLVVYMAATAIF